MVGGSSCFRRAYWARNVDIVASNQMVGCNEQVTKTKRESSAKLPVDFQASLLSIGQLTVVFHASRPDAAGPVQQTSTCHLDGSPVGKAPRTSVVDSIIAAGRDDAGSKLRCGALRSWESKKLIALAGLPLIGRYPSEILWEYARSLARSWAIDAGALLPHRYPATTFWVFGTKKKVMS